MKLKLSYLLFICLLMGSCSGGTSSNVSDSGTSASPSSNPGYTSSNPSTPTNTNSNPNTPRYSVENDPSLAGPLNVLKCGNTYNISTCYTNPQ
jgi:hypothetical protein